ncbi:hypothetical protein AC578_8110 [Pseudocercospora eumusae]|uniref:Nephrocystin 3-like N-terminal domain-containing protein n=1 Tax=Pseudocercospora eumusae TaxID=321146 RepID=A0A139H0M8_9PEZI|nr:hypothetical protein AC578_8110 [Pseudocercospora eumusae]
MSEPRSSSGQGGPSSWQGNVVSGNARVQNGHHYGETYNITYPGAAPTSLRDQILDSLWFDMMEARQDNIKGATPKTLDWIYEHERASSEEDPDVDDPDVDDPDDQNLDNDNWDEQHQYRQGHWDSLATWLEEDHSIYWVCGKAGSGKSTLMAHIMDDYRTVECLSRWARDKPLHILKFFFWRPGTELQKSINGLLRTILYQICTDVDEIVQNVAKAVRWQPGRHASWTDKRLNLAIKAALTSSNDVFCLFLDGLDEFVGDLGNLMEFIHQFEATENVKICVSSRPEAELTANFSACKQLRLERLNRADIEKFVKSQLHRLQHTPVFKTPEFNETYSDFVYYIVHRADGVFLWAVLVLPMLVRGISSGDDWDMLNTRLAMTPTAINDLYANMLANLDPLHRESFHFYLELMDVFWDEHNYYVSIALVTASQLGDGLLNMPYENFLNACDLERLRIISRSAGLLQISEARLDPSAGCVAIPQLIAHDGYPSAHIHSARDAAKLRKPIALSQNTEARFRATRDVVDWVHRSAHDFVFPPDGSASPVCISRSGRADVWKKCLLGSVNSLAVLPSFTWNRYTSSQLRLYVTIRATERGINTGIETAIALEIAEEIRLVVCNMHNEDFGENYRQPYARGELGSSLLAFSFWVEFLGSDAWFLLQALMPVLLSEQAGNAILMPLWCGLDDLKRHLGSRAEHISMPILEKIEQNIWFSGEASARLVLFLKYDEYLDAQRPAVWRPSHFSCIVPDFLGPRQPAAMHPFLQRYLSARPREFSDMVAVADTLDRIAESICLFSDIELLSRSTDDGMRIKQYRVLLQCSPRLRRWFQDLSMSLGMLPEYYNEFRIICRPAGFPLSNNGIERLCGMEVPYQEITEYVYLAPSLRTCSCLFLDIKQELGKAGNYLSFTLSNDAMLHQWTQWLVEDIWQNDQGLDATQQLYALACVKFSIPRWLGCRMSVDWDLIRPLINT